jgi:alanine dehydrogenase
LTLYLTESDVEALLPMSEVIDAVESAMKELGEKTATNNPRLRVQTSDHVLNVLSAGAQLGSTFGLKCYTTLADGTKPASTLIWIYDANTGALDAIVQATLLTRMRTGAASAVATRRLARKNSKTIGLIGAGRIGEMQLEALLQDPRFREVFVFDFAKGASSRLVQTMGKKFPGVEWKEAADTSVVAARSDVIVTATFSEKPVIDASTLRSGTHLNAVGSNSRSRTEVDKTCFKGASAVVVDYKEQCKAEAGDLIRAVEEGYASWDRVIELSDLVSGSALFNRRDEDITIFKSVGIAIEDVVAARKLCTKARELGVGKDVPVA